MKKAIIWVLILYFFQGVIHNLGHPITPYLVSDLGIEDYMFGVFFATMSFGLMLGGPIWGVLGDRGNKRIYMVAGLLVYSIGQFMFGYAGNQYVMVFFRFISGFGVAASVTLLLSHLISLAPKEERTKYIAWSVAMFTIGSSLGYYLGGFISTNQFFINLLGTDDFKKIFLIQAILNIFHAINMYIQIKEVKNSSLNEKKASFIQGFLDIGKMNKNLIIFLISLTFISIGMINLSKFIDVYFKELGYNPNELGTFVFWTGIVSLLTSIFIVPLVVKLKKELTIMIWIQVISSVIIFFVFRGNNILLLLYTVFMIYVILKAIYAPLEQNYISTFAHDGKYGTIMGVRQSFFAIGMVIGPLVGGFLYNINPLYVFDFSILMFILGLVLLLAVRKRLRNGIA
ncbi:MAG: MFS transporter [Candidatus Izimaplasma sp.]|nr:MFS transporter [Candidatus Izimaplasma bacterium]